MSKSLAPLLEGKMIRGYKLEQLLGSGSTTAVYRARTMELWLLPELIITVLLVPELLSAQAQQSFSERFSRDAERVIAFRHPHVFPLYGYGEEHGHPYLLTPDVEGEVLKTRLREHKRFSPDEVLAIIAPVAEALDYLHHEGFVYRTLSSSNVLILPDNTIQLIGSGLTQFLSLQGLGDDWNISDPFPHLKSIAGTYLGAPEYLAPEVIRGTAVDGRSDVYSLGILLFELLSGQPPFTGQDYVEVVHKQMREPLPSLHTVCPELPVSLELVVNHALHRNPSLRFQKASDLVAAYRHVLKERLNAHKTFALIKTIEKIGELPSPAPLLSLRSLTQADDPENSTTAWPYSLLPSFQQEQSSSFQQALSTLNDDEPQAFTEQEADDDNPFAVPYVTAQTALPYPAQTSNSVQKYSNSLIDEEEREEEDTSSRDVGQGESEADAWLNSGPIYLNAAVEEEDTSPVDFEQEEESQPVSWSTSSPIYQEEEAHGEEGGEREEEEESGEEDAKKKDEQDPVHSISQPSSIDSMVEQSRTMREKLLKYKKEINEITR